MVGDGDGPRGARRLADGDVLVEGGGAGDGRLVDLLVDVDIVDPAVAGHRALVGADLLVPNGSLHDIVLDQRVGVPPVDREKANTAGGEGTAVSDRVGIAGLPSKADDKISIGVVLDAEGACALVRGVSDTSARGDVVLIVVDGLGTLGEDGGRVH